MKFRYSRDYYPAAPMVDGTFIAAAEQERIGPLPVCEG